ncbi:MAG TPA: aminomethyl-transferring glycine dehydrogenase subunit GcvPA [Candidatus Bipolaricaulota bacterium]
MHEYIPATAADRNAMLAAIGAQTVEEFFSNIPAEVKRRFKPLNLPALTELETRQHLQSLAAENVDPARTVSFMGAGIYDHDLPSVVNHLLLRQEFLTCYTPYQAELSQGTLTWMFEFQTMVCELTGLDVANSSMYDGASALAEGLMMAERVTKRKRFAVAKSLNPAQRRVLDTFRWARGWKFVDIPFDPQTGQLDRAALETKASKEPWAGLVLQTPNFLGIVEDLSELKGKLGPGFLIVSANPLALGLLEPPGAFGADVVACEGQPLGHAQNFGGPLLGMFAAHKEHIRQMPGRIAGRTVDVEGKTGYVMTLQAREQHIRRAKATSNICTNQALLALGTTIYLSLLGKHGVRALAELNAQKAHYLAQQLEGAGYARAFSGPFFNEFAIRAKGAKALKRRLYRKNVLVLDPDVLKPLKVKDALLLAVTEKRTRAQLDRLIELMKEP